jgi:hypothetical protein
MKPVVSLAIVLAFGLAPPASAGDKLTTQEKVELIRGLMAEYATVKQLLPRSKKPLPIDVSGKIDKEVWDEAAQEMGPAARTGDLVQITKVKLEDDRIEFEINGGVKSGRRWYDRVEVGTGSRTTPIGQSGAPTAGTNLVLLFGKPLEALKSSDVKQILKPLLDFEKRSVTEVYTETLPPEVQTAIKEKKAIEGMDREQVILAMGRPVRKSRESKDGVDYEDWIYGQAPGKITFVTFSDGKVAKVKESYAGLGAEAAAPLPVK